MDEAGSRVRIRAFRARGPGGEAAAQAALRELHDVQDAKAQAVKARSSLCVRRSLKLRVFNEQKC